MKTRVVNVGDGRSMTRLANLVHTACRDNGVDDATAQKIVADTIAAAVAEGYVVTKQVTP